MTTPSAKDLGWLITAEVPWRSGWRHLPVETTQSKTWDEEIFSCPSGITSLKKIAILRQEEKGHFLSVGASGMVLGPPRALHVQRSGSKRIYYSKEMFAELIKAQVHRKGGWLTLVLHNWIVKYIWSILLSFDDFNWDKDFFKCECHFNHQDKGGRSMSIDTNKIFFLHFFNTS